MMNTEARIDEYLCFITGQQQLLMVISDIHCKNSVKVCIMSSCAISQPMC